MAPTTTPDTVTVLGRNATGIAVAELRGQGVNGAYSFRYALSPCCAADATGVSYGTGIACRACYATLPAEFGTQVDGPLAVVFGDGVDLPTFRAIAGIKVPQ
jgi:hypothetical protein